MSILFFFSRSAPSLSLLLLHSQPVAFTFLHQQPVSVAQHEIHVSISFCRECSSFVVINKNIPNCLSIIMLIVKTITSAYQSVNHLKKILFFLLGITYTEENEHWYSFQYKYFNYFYY